MIFLALALLLSLVRWLPCPDTSPNAQGVQPEVPPPKVESVVTQLPNATTQPIRSLQITEHDWQQQAETWLGGKMFVETLGSGPSELQVVYGEAAQLRWLAQAIANRPNWAAATWDLAAAQKNGVIEKPYCNAKLDELQQLKGQTKRSDSLRAFLLLNATTEGSCDGTGSGVTWPDLRSQLIDMLDSDFGVSAGGAVWTWRQGPGFPTRVLLVCHKEVASAARRAGHACTASDELQRGTMCGNATVLRSAWYSRPGPQGYTRDDQDALMAIGRRLPLDAVRYFLLPSSMPPKPWTTPATPTPAPPAPTPVSTANPTTAPSAQPPCVDGQRGAAWGWLPVRVNACTPDVTCSVDVSWYMLLGMDVTLAALLFTELQRARAKAKTS